MSLTPKQLPLTFGRDDAYTFARYLPGSNLEIYDALLGLITLEPVPAEGLCVFLHGAEGVGKSHLLQAICQAASEQKKTSVYLSFTDRKRFDPEILQGLETLSYVCLDDVEQIAGDRDWEQALFHLFNRSREVGNTLILSALNAPAQIDFSLPDLASRMNWGLIYQVQDLSDHDKISVLQQRAAVRNFDLPNDVGEFMIRRLPRDMHVLCSYLDKLDIASLAAQRKLTVRFVSKFLDSIS